MNRRHNIKPLSASLWVYLMPILLVVPNIALAFTEYYPLTVKLANIILPWGFYQLIMGLWKRTGVTILLLFPVSVLCAFQIVLLYLYGENIIAIDMFMNVMTTNPTEALELLDNLKLAMVTVFVLYLPPLIIAIIMIRKKKFAPKYLLLFSRRLGVAGIAIGAIIAGISLFNDSTRLERQIFPYNVYSNIVTAVQRKVEAVNYPETSRAFSYMAKSLRPDTLPEVYVFVIGETSRADNWSLFGYDRPTNPRLSKRRGLVGFPRTLSEINTTHKSVPMLMSNLDARTFGDSVAFTRSVFQAFAESGFRTVYVSNQSRNHSYIDYYGEEADEATFLTDKGKVHPDFYLVDRLQQVLADTVHRKIFVVLHSYGSHFEYNKRYPRSMAHFRPDAKSEAGKDNRPQLVNAYDNTIRYTDMVIDSIIGVLAERNVASALIYTSDHGEDIFDDSRNRFLHASPNPTYWQLHVPLVVWMSPRLQQLHPDFAAAAAHNAPLDVSSTRSVFHTLLDLGGISSPYYRPEQSLVSGSYRPQEHIYLNDYNEALKLRESGLREPDFEQLHRTGITY